MLSQNLLMVFIKNPALGKVKTRLAKTVGDEMALHVYQKLLAHTHNIASSEHWDKAVFYSDFIDNNDIWKKDRFQQFIQEGDESGDKMANAFIKAFEMGYQKVVIIGSDCLELTEKIIDNALNTLKECDVVIGPAKDGGYYLLGMKMYHKQLFANKQWSTEYVLPETISDMLSLNLTYKLLPVLSDVDNEMDLHNHPNMLER